MTEEVIIKKSISLRQDIYQYAVEESEKKHGGNFSAFLTYFLSCQKNNTGYVIYNNGKAETILTKDRIEKLLMYENWINDILDLFDESITIVDKTHLTINTNVLKRLIDKHFVKSMGIDKKYDLSITI
jgi:hypothetical protein